MVCLYGGMIPNKKKNVTGTCNNSVDGSQSMIDERSLTEIHLSDCSHMKFYKRKLKKHHHNRKQVGSCLGTECMG